MLVEVVNPENNASFEMNINDIDTDGFDVYCKAHEVWGEENWHILHVNHEGNNLANMINSSTMTPNIVE